MLDKRIDERDIYVDKASGKDFNRHAYQAMKHNVREGDLIVIDALDRLGRNYDEIIKEWKHITRERNADIVVLENESLFDSRKFKAMGDMGKLMEDQFLSLLSYVAKQERKKIKQRQAEGIAVAKEKGKHLGRPQMNINALRKEQKQLFDSLYPQWKESQITAVEFMNRLDVKKTTFYKIVKEYESQLESKGA